MHDLRSKCCDTEAGILQSRVAATRIAVSLLQVYSFTTIALVMTEHHERGVADKSNKSVGMTFFTVSAHTEFLMKIKHLPKLIPLASSFMQNAHTRSDFPPSIA